MQKWICTVCKYVYDPEVGDPTMASPLEPCSRTFRTTGFALYALYIKNYLNRSKRSLSEKERGYTNEDKFWFSCNGIPGSHGHADRIIIKSILNLSTATRACGSFAGKMNISPFDTRCALPETVISASPSIN